jgi:hypothetical protein
MASKSDFTPEEWKQLVAAAPMVGLAVTAASPNGPFGVMKEMMAVGMAMAEVIQKGSSNALVSAVITDVKERATRPESPKVRSAEEAQSTALAAVKDVAGILAQKAPGDAAGFNAWLMEIGKRVAEASNEGGFFGFGGTRVSDAEKAVLGKLAAALGQPTPS